MDNYIEQALKTESIELSSFDHPRLLHASIGLTTEVAELLLAEDGDIPNVKEELGDCLWYGAIVADCFSCTFADLILIADKWDDPLKDLLKAATDALDHMRKVSFYGVEVDDLYLGNCFGTAIACVIDLGEAQGWKLSELQQTNIGKLRKRYGEKFTTEAAVNRDTEAEMEAVGT